MTELMRRDDTDVAVYAEDPTGGRLVAWAQAAAAANQLAKALTTTAFVPAAFKGNAGDATAAILMGDELGLSPLAALRSIYVVHGAPAMYARTMVALAQAHGHEVWTEKSTDTEVVVCGKRRGTDKVERAVWTIARAQKAGYTKNNKYGSNPQEMLYSKAAAEIARKIAADVLAGVPYSVEDIELDTPTTATDTTPAKPTRVQRAPRPAPEPTPEPDLTPPSLDETRPDASAPEFITDAQLRKLQASYTDIGMTDRDERLAHASAFVGRDLDSSKALTKTEASQLIDSLAALVEPTADDLFEGGAE